MSRAKPYQLRLTFVNYVLRRPLAFSLGEAAPNNELKKADSIHSGSLERAMRAASNFSDPWRQEFLGNQLAGAARSDALTGFSFCCGTAGIFTAVGRVNFVLVGIKMLCTAGNSQFATRLDFR